MTGQGLDRNAPGDVKILYRLNDDPNGEIRTFVPSGKSANQDVNLGIPSLKPSTNDVRSWETNAYQQFFQEVEKVESTFRGFKGR